MSSSRTNSTGARLRSTSSNGRPGQTWMMDAADRAKSKSLDPPNEEDLDLPPKRPYFYAALCLLLYGLSFGLAIPAFPAITLRVCEGDSALSAQFYGIGMTLRYGTEFFASPVAGTMADIIGRKPIFIFCFLCHQLVAPLTNCTTNTTVATAT